MTRRRCSCRSPHLRWTLVSGRSRGSPGPLRRPTLTGLEQTSTDRDNGVRRDRPPIEFGMIRNRPAAGSSAWKSGRDRRPRLTVPSARLMLYLVPIAGPTALRARAYIA